MGSKNLLKLNAEVAISDLRKKAEDLLAFDISHDVLGKVNGFHKAESIKKEICEFSQKIMNGALRFEGQLNEAVLEKAINDINVTFGELSVVVEQVGYLAKNGVYNADFPSQRSGLLDRFRSLLSSLKECVHPLEVELKILEMQKEQENPSYFRETREDVDELKKRLEDKEVEINKILDSLQSRTVSQGVEESKSDFNDLTGSHKRFEWWWFSVLCASLIFSACVVWSIFSMKPDNVLDWNVVAGFLQKMLLLSAVGVLMRISLTKYNTERKLRIVYQHRSKVLDHYRSFEAGIGDDTQAKNAFRLEIAKYIFSDPKTGYDQESSTGTEINLNPVVSAVENLAKR